MARAAAQTSRADLLRLLAAARPQALTLDDDGQNWFGYQRQGARAASGARLAPHLTASAALAGSLQALPARRAPLTLPQVWAVVDSRALPPVDEPPTDEAPVEPLPASVLQVDAATAPREAEPLLPWPRLHPALGRQVRRWREGGTDLAMLTRLLADGRVPPRLPRERRGRWNPDLVVVLDFSPRLWPYREDMHALCRQLLRHCGRTGLSLRVTDGGPPRHWTDWLWLAGTRKASAGDQRWGPLPPGADLLLVSDLGLLAPADGAGDALRGHWRAFVRRTQAGGVRVQALAPLGIDQLDAVTAAALPVLRWSTDSRLRAEAGLPPGAVGRPAGLDELLALVAAAQRVDPPLLRALRHTLREGAGNAGLEGAVWAHPDLWADSACGPRPERAAPHLRRFDALPPTQQQRQRALRCAHQAHLGVALSREQDLRWAAVATGCDDAVAVAEAAARFFQGVLAAVGAPGRAGDGNAEPPGWFDLARGVLDRADAATVARCAGLFHALLAATLAARPTGDAALPAWTDAARLSAERVRLPPLRPAQRYWLVEDGVHDVVQLQPEPAGPGQVGLAPPWTDAQAILVTASGAATLLPFDGRRHLLARRGAREALRLVVAGQHLEVGPVRRPSGAVSWDRPVPGGSGQVDVFVRSLSGQSLLLNAERQFPGVPFFGPMRGDGDRRRRVFRTGTREEHGSITAEYSADSFGLMLRLRLPGAYQDFRWIEPGSFLMGSPDNEPGRDSDEGPQHIVTITRGFWLADTPCTQALWQALVGENPSHFAKAADAAERPVENVSWDDVVHRFMPALGELLPEGCASGLPTEAEWEYACRAGTATAYHWGDPWDAAKANVDTEETTRVKRYAPNGWGLYDMHGNVWEWCGDLGKRAYRAQAEEDPQGPPEQGLEEVRLLRGGAWCLAPARARAACRLLGLRLNRWHSRGFRLALRSPSPVQPSQGIQRPEGAEAAEPPGLLPAEPAAARGAGGARRRDPPGQPKR